MKTIHLLISGRVQGVFYRATAKKIAEQLGIKGRIRNTPEGKVEIKAAGSSDNLEEFIAWCRKGPSQARVDEITETEIHEDLEEGFRITR